MNITLSTSLRRLTALLMILILLPSMAVFADSGPRPEVAAPFEAEFVPAEALGGALLQADSMHLLSGGNVFQNGADRLAAMQRTDGGWGWPLTYPEGTPSAQNTVGPIAQGLAQAYLHTGDAIHRDALEAAGELLLAKTNTFSPSDGYLAATLDEVFGVTTYITHVKTHFYDPLAHGTYLRNGDTTQYTTAAYINRIRTIRSGPQANMAAWDIGMGLVGAAAAGAETDEWVAATKAEIDELDGDNYYDVSGLAGALYGLAYVDEEFDPTAGEHQAAGNLTDLGAILASYQIGNGGFTWNSAYVIPNDANETVQETAYAMLALNELDRTLYLSRIQGAADYLESVQLPTGGWAGYVGDPSGENNELTGEALWAISTAYPEAWVCPSGNCGHPGASFNTIQAAIDASSAGAAIYVFPGDYNETASGRTLLAGTSMAQGPHQFGLFFPNTKPGLSLIGVDATGEPLTDPNSADLPYITTNATNSFGASGIWVEGEDVTIQGFEIGPNIPGDNKTIEIVADGFVLKHSNFSIPDGGGAVYFGDWLYDAVNGISVIERYTIDHNLFDDGTQVAISSGAGYSGPVAGRRITNNVFTMGGVTWPGVSFNGIVPSVGWFVHPVGGATITGNTFSGSTQYIRSRGIVGDDFDWAAYWNDNTFDKKVMAGPNPPAQPRAYTYMSGSYSMTNTRVIGSVIAEEVGHAEPGDTVLVGAGTYVQASLLTLDKANLKLQGQGAPLVQVSGSGERIHISASGVTIDGFKIEKTDKIGLQNIIAIQASNTAITNNEIFGQFVIGDGDTTRAIVIYAGNFSDLNISGNTIHGLRQPAYISGTHTGTIANNYTYGTKGWVVEGGNLTFTDNTWGTGADVNVYDIAILSLVNPAHYTDIVAMAAANNGAVIEDQRVSPAVLSHVYVDAATSFSSDLGGRYHPYASIAPAITRVVPGGTIHVAGGTYLGNLTVNKPLTLSGPNVGVDPNTGTRVAEAVVQSLVSVTAGNVTVDGFTLTNPGQPYALSISPSSSGALIANNIVENVGDVALNSNVHAIVFQNGADSVTIAHNRFDNIKAGGKSVNAIGVLDSLSTDPSTGVVIRENVFTNIASATKGAYGIIFNNAAGVPGAQIRDNTFTGLSGSWTHAIGLEGPTSDAVVTGNVFNGLTAAGADNVAIHFEKNPLGNTVTISNNQFNGTAFYGVAIHPNDLPGGSNGLSYTVTAAHNWWGSDTGPGAVASGAGALVGLNVHYAPWCADAGCTSLRGPVHNVTQDTYYGAIQPAIDAALAGDVIEVAAGTYAGDLTIDKPLSLLGPNAAVNPNTGTRLAEAVIVPGTSNPNPAVCTNMVYLATSDITIKGFTFDGDNPALTSGVLINGADVDACELLAGYDGMGNIVVENNILRHSTYTGIDFYNYNNSAATAGNYIRYNLFEDIGETTYNWGVGILVYNNFYADITDNVLNRVRTGIQTGNFEKANPGTTGRISNNLINAWRLGIFHNLWYSNASVISVDHNTINAVTYPGATKWNGMLLSSFQGNANTIVADNIINIPAGVSFPAPGYTAGYNVWSDSTAAPLTISGGTVTGGDYGVFVNNYEGYGSNGANTSIILDGLTIQDSLVAGVYVKDSPSNSNGSTVFAEIRNCTIDTAATGILIEGADAAAKANFNKITGNPALGLNNTTATPVNAEKNWWGSASPVWASTVSANVLYAPWCTNEDCTTFANLPVHNVTTDTYYLTIQAAINAAGTGDTIQVAAGTYDEDVNLNKSLSLIGAGAASTTIRGVIGGDIATVRVNASNVEVAGFTITRLGNNLTEWNDAGLNSAGIAIIGTSLTGMNIHDNILSGNRTGMDINNSSGHTIHNNVIADNRTGLLFRNQTDNLTVTENDITNNWTVGVLFLDASSGSNNPVQTALGSNFSHNNISGNWYGQVVDRQTGGSLPLPGTTNLKNFAENWWGTVNPMVSIANSTEPSYASQIPVAYGGTAVAPGSQPDILGTASANIIYEPRCGDTTCSILVQPSGLFSKSSPADGATEQSLNPIITWGISTGANLYEYCYDTTNDGMCSNWVNTGAFRSATLSGLDANTTYYWQVRAIKGGAFTYANGSQTAYWSFKTGTVPSPFSKGVPFNGAKEYTTSPILSWGISVGATSYEYCYDTTNDGACSNWVNTGTTRSASLSGLLQNTTYYWQVRALNSYGNTYANGSETTYWAFRTGNFVGNFSKSLPPNGSTGQLTSPILTWGISVGATSYEYCYDTTNDGACSNWVSTGMTRSASLSGLLQNTTYYWQVRAINSYGNTYANSSETAYWSFKTGLVSGAFSKSLPYNGITGQLTNPILVWGISPRATSYEYCYDTTNDGACSNWVSTGMTRSASLSGLELNTTYYWQVRAINDFGTTYANGTQADFWYFKTGTVPGMFDKGSPYNGSIGQSTSLTLVWGISPRATSYEYCYDTTNDGVCSNWVSTGMTRSASLSGLDPNTIYYWQVRAINSFGVTYANGSETAFWGFRTVP